MSKSSSVVIVPSRLRPAVVLRVEEHACEVWTEDKILRVPFAPMFPAPRTERVSPGHLVAIATPPNGDNEVVVWRWYDAVVLDDNAGAMVRLYEPAHGEVVAERRKPQPHKPGSRVYCSAGLPGADWWACGVVTAQPEDVDVDLHAVEAFYTEHGLWEQVFGAAK